MNDVMRVSLRLSLFPVQRNVQSICVGLNKRCYARMFIKGLIRPQTFFPAA